MKVAIYSFLSLVSTLAFAAPKEGESYFIKSIESNKYLSDRDGELRLGDEDQRATFTIERKGDSFYLRLPNGQYVSAAKRTEADVGNRGRVNFQPHAQEWEKFTFAKANTKGAYYIRSRHWNTYLRANIKYKIVDQTDVAQSWERFEFIKAKAPILAEDKSKEAKLDMSLPVEGVSYYLKAVDTDEDEYVYDRGDGLGPLGTKAQRATFTVERKGDNFYLRLANGKYVSAAKRTGDDNANSRGKVNFQPHAQEWEKLTFVKTDRKGVYHIMSSQWKTQLRADIPNDIVDQADANNRWDGFEFILAKPGNQADGKGKSKEVLENEDWAKYQANNYFLLKQGNNGDLILNAKFHRYFKENVGVDTTPFKTWEQLPYKLKMQAGHVAYEQLRDDINVGKPIPHPDVAFDD